MAEQHLITAEFFGAPVSIIDHAGKRWLTAEQIGRCLGYDESNARKGVIKLFERHGDEFSEADTCVVNLTTQDQARAMRIFSGTGCRLLGFFANTPTAKKFRAWAATELEARTVPAPLPLPDVIRSPRVEAQLATLTGHMGELAQGMRTVITQMDVTRKYIGLLELNQAGTRKVTAAVAREAAALKAEGMNNADIGRLLRISRTAVSLIVRDKYPVAIPEAERPKPVGEILEGWIEREQQRVAGTLEKLEGGAS